MPPTFRSDAHSLVEAQFPKLKGRKWSIKSPFDDEYKCIAWAACCTTHHWWPSTAAFWPLPVSFPPDETIVAFIRAFETLGYQPCGNARFEFGFQKVAIYAGSDGNVRHMARQRFWGRGWLSKAGVMEDIAHPDLESIEGDPIPGSFEYGEVRQILKRSWLSILRTPCNCSRLRCPGNAFKFLLYRLSHKYVR